MIFITATGTVHVSNRVLFLVTITFLDLLMIHWIQGKSFQRNSNGLGAASSRFLGTRSLSVRYNNQILPVHKMWSLWNTVIEILVMVRGISASKVHIYSPCRAVNCNDTFVVLTRYVLILSKCPMHLDLVSLILYRYPCSWYTDTTVQLKNWNKLPKWC